MLAEDSSGGSFAGISVAVDQLVAATQNGGFSISENGGQALLSAIHEVQTEVASALQHFSNIQQQLPLGTTPNATIYKPFIESVASDPTQGSIPALRKLQTDLEDAHTAIQKSISATRDTDVDAGVNISGSFGDSGTGTFA